MTNLPEFKTRIGFIVWKNIPKLFPIDTRVAYIPPKGNYIRLGRVSGYCRQVHPVTFFPYMEPIISWDIKSIIFIDGPYNPRYLRLIKKVCPST